MSEELLVTLKYANNLEDADWLPGGGTTDAFAVVSLIVDGKAVQSQRSTTKNNTSNPVWNEVFKFQIDPTMIQRPGNVLHIEIKDADKTGVGIIDWAISDDPLGKVQIALADICRDSTGRDFQYKLAANKEPSVTLSWERRSYAPGIPGQYPVHVDPVPIPGWMPGQYPCIPGHLPGQYPYTPGVPTPPPGAQAKSQLIVTLISAQGLQDADWMPGGGSSDAYATLAVGTAGKALAQPQRSSTKNNNSNPVWNEQFTFDVGQQDISKAILYIDVKDNDKTGISLVDFALRDDDIGQVRIPLSHLVHNATGMPAKYPLDDKGALLVISCKFQTQAFQTPGPVPGPQPCTPCTPIYVVQQPVYYSQPVSYSVVQPSSFATPCVRSPSYSTTTVVRAPSYSAPVVAGPVIRVPSYSAVNRTPSVSVVGAPAYQTYPAAYTRLY